MKYVIEMSVKNVDFDIKNELNEQKKFKRRQKSR